jgi:hypothetical protein
MGHFRDDKNVLKRSLDEITQDSIETVLELISQNSLYRGAESKAVLEIFLAAKKEYAKVPNTQKDTYCWAKITTLNSISRIRNTAIGTLLVNISEGMDLDEAVTAFERIMAPTNYKRPNTIISKSMIESAEKTIKELGLEASLGRRFATPEDITANNVLFINRDSKKGTTIFDQLKEQAPVNPKSLSKTEEVTIEDFISKILPKVSTIELLLENNHSGNLVSLIAPKDKEAPSLFKWDNNFSWSYNNALADSMKERVKAAGGNVEGVLRFSIQWNEDRQSICDLDAHAWEPSGNEIFFRTHKHPRISAMSGFLDVDMIRPSGIGIENITWIDSRKMKAGSYRFSVHNYDGGRNTGFSAEVEINGEIYSFHYPRKIEGMINVAEVIYSKDGFAIKPLIEANSTVQSKEVWGLKTNTFQKVSMILKSPNYWDDRKVGNEHVFFILDGAHNDGQVRGFFNEFLKEEFTKHRKVFEVLGSKMKVEPADKQLSGLGFSTTTKGEVIAKVTGAFSRTLKIKF